MSRRSQALEELELELFLEALHRHHGLDFRDYALPSLRRRVLAAVRAEGLATVSGLQEKVLHDPGCVGRLVPRLSVGVTTMFRDPSFYAAFREKVVPQLRAFPSVRIWHAGCSTGEEVYSMAILLEEEGLLGRARLYATDLDATALERARAGIFTLGQMQEYTANYQRAGGQSSFSEYYTARYDHAIFRQHLKKHMFFSQHSLATDGPFNEFNVVLCRNVLIYFNEVLEERAHRLFRASLVRRGFLALGQREVLVPAIQSGHYAEIDRREKIYKKIQ